MRLVLSVVLAFVISSSSFGQDINKYQRDLSSYRNRPLADLRADRYNENSLRNPHGAGSPYKSDGLMNPYSENRSDYSSKSWRNPYASSPPRIYSEDGYHGELSTNRYRSDSTSNSYGRYGSRYSPESINNPYGAGSRYSTRPLYVFPSRK